MPEWATIWAFVACILAGATLWYMLRHDTKSDWAEVHKAMTNVLAAQKSAVAEKGSMGSGMSGVPNPFAERKIQFDDAVTQLRGQLNRVAKDSLSSRIGELLDRNRDTSQWLSDNFRRAFEEFMDQAAEKTR
jgi:hypothetical protein